MLALTVSCAALSPQFFQIRTIDSCSARSLARAWHELYSERGQAHDFGDMLGPDRGKGLFYASIRNEDVRAIARCEKNAADVLRVVSLAHAPDHGEAASAAVHLLHAQGIEGDLHRLTPRWRCEALFACETVPPESEE